MTHRMPAQSSVRASTVTVTVAFKFNLQGQVQLQVDELEFANLFNFKFNKLKCHWHSEPSWGGSESFNAKIRLQVYKYYSVQSPTRTA